MAMEIYVLSDRQLRSLSEWQAAIKAEGFALTLSTARSFADIRHFLPVQLNGAQTGFECDHWSARDVIEGYSNVRFLHQWRYCLAFRWGADLKASLAGYMAAAAYAVATGGVVLDCEQSEILAPQQAIHTARDIEAQLPAMEQALRVAMEKLKQG
jgi:hypothetical protein